MTRKQSHKTLKLFVLALGSLIGAALLAAPAGSASVQELDLTFLGRTAAVGETGAEISTFDPQTKRAFVTNALDNTLDIFDVSDPTNPGEVDSIDLDAFGGLANSVDFTPHHGGLLAVAMESIPKTTPGEVVFLDVDGNFVDRIGVGAQPDMLTFTDDGRRLLVANEGEPADDGIIDPEGSVTIFDFEDGLDDVRRRTAGFAGVPVDADVRIFGPDTNVSRNLEPEYITYHGNRAWVSIQDNNAVGLLDLDEGKFTAVRALGFKDHGLPENALDPSDEDGGINIDTWPNLYGIYQPDAIAAYTLPETKQVTQTKPKRNCNKGKPKKPKSNASAAAKKKYKKAVQKFKKAKKKCQQWNKTKRVTTKTVTEDVVRIATANEGDSRAWGYFDEESRVSDLDLDPAVFPAGTADDEALGRLTVTTTLGDADNDDLYEKLFVFGGRSMSLLNADGSIGFDTGSQMEEYTAGIGGGDFFNLDHSDDSDPDNRSDNKGPEAEGLAVGLIDGRPYSFVGLERQSGILAYDLGAVPGEAVFAGYINTRDSDRGPEGLEFISAEDSPTGKPLVTFTSEITGTLAFVEVSPAA